MFADYGGAVELPPGCDSTQGPGVYTQGYAAPERLQREGVMPTDTCSHESDTWSVGVILAGLVDMLDPSTTHWERLFYLMLAQWCLLADPVERLSAYTAVQMLQEVEQPEAHDANYLMMLRICSGTVTLDSKRVWTTADRQQAMCFAIEQLRLREQLAQLHSMSGCLAQVLANDIDAQHLLASKISSIEAALEQPVGVALDVWAEAAPPLASRFVCSCVSTIDFGSDASSSASADTSSGSSSIASVEPSSSSSSAEPTDTSSGTLSVASSVAPTGLSSESSLATPSAQSSDWSPAASLDKEPILATWRGPSSMCHLPPALLLLLPMLELQPTTLSQAAPLEMRLARLHPWPPQPALLEATPHPLLKTALEPEDY
eukprot:347649-Chlamydomonas_euryale.AAC.1